MKVYKTKKYKSWIRIRNHLDITTTTKKIIIIKLCNMYIDPMSLVQKEKPQSHLN